LGTGLGVVLYGPLVLTQVDVSITTVVVELEIHNLDYTQTLGDVPHRPGSAYATA
jgi:hypothetical protein